MTHAVRSEHRDRLLEAVDDIASVLRECAPEAERERRLPLSAVEAMQDAGLFRCAAPAAVGGLEADPLTQVEVFEATAAVDGAAGWNLMISAILTEVIGARVGDDAAEAIFSSSRFPIAAGLVWPRGKAVPVDGGYTVSGRWSFGSGIHQSDWVLGGSLIMENGKPRTGPDGTPVPRMTVFPRKEVAIHDNWHVAGLRGTGSCDYSVDAAFVPEAFTFNAYQPLPGRSGPWAALPGPVITAAGHAGFALGIARGVLRELETTVAAATRSMSQSTTGDRESFQLALGRHTVAYDAARTLVLDSHRDVWEAACRGEAPSPGQVSRMRISALYATEVAVEIAQFGYRAAGTAALFEASPIQRALRDILAAQQHIFVRDTAYVDLAKARIASGAGAPG